MNNKKSANIYVIISIAMGYLLSLVFDEAFLNGTETALATNLLNIVNNVAVTAVPIGIYLLFNKERFKKQFKKVPVKKMAGYILLTPFVWAAATYINIGVNSWLGKAGIVQVEQLPVSDDAAVVITGFVLACIVAPVFEELLYRGAVLSLLKGYGKGAAVAVTAVLFAFAHGSITLFASTLVCGLVLGYVTVCSGSIFPAMLIHFGYNFISWAILNFKTTETANGIIAVFMILAGSAAVIWAVIKAVANRKKISKALGGVLKYIKNPLWIPILADFVFRNYLYHR